MEPQDTKESLNSLSRKKQPKKAFSVGPANLPNGAHKHKVQKIKHDLIRTAKVKKDYARLKHQESRPEPSVRSDVHPQRQAMLAETPTTSEELPAESRSEKRRTKFRPLERERERAQLEKEKRDLEHKEAEEKRQEQRRKRAEYQKFRKSVEKARRPDKKGQRRLGRECKLLPRMVETLLQRLDGNAPG